jgi:HK97 family phage prohead protease
MADKAIETRTVTSTLEFREEGDAPVLEGYAATFDARGYDMGAFVERIDPSAFSRTLGMAPDVRLLIDHAGQPLARTKSGTLTLTPDATGLRARAELDPTDPDVQRLMPKMRRGDLDQMSFAFRVDGEDGDSWEYPIGGKPVRTLRSLNLSGGDVSVVTYPANPGTSVSVRAEDERTANLAFVTALLTRGAPLPEDHADRFYAAVAALTETDFRSLPPVAEEITPEPVDTGSHLLAQRRLALLRIAG